MRSIEHLVYTLFIGGLVATTITINMSSATVTTNTTANGEDRSVHSAGIDEIHNVPMSVIHRPIPSVLDDDKVKSLMETIDVCACVAVSLYFKGVNMIFLFSIYFFIAK